ncbi:MAG TPA: hypothetical protein VEX68_27000, partial [Bryobacteraceae bacterium]|nr:hypothetical protein [Bryobacteraceae bacterium]
DVAGLLRLLGRSQGELRSEVKYQLARSELRQSAIPHLIGALPDRSVSKDVAELLVGHGVIEARDSLVSALEKWPQPTRLEALWSLSNEMAEKKMLSA